MFKFLSIGLIYLFNLKLYNAIFIRLQMNPNRVKNINEIKMITKYRSFDLEPLQTHNYMKKNCKMIFASLNI